MSANDKVFTGSIPSIYDSHMVPMLFRPYAADLAGRVAEAVPKSLLETAAGTGVLTKELLARLERATPIIATDLNQAMLDMTAAKLPEKSVTTRACDAMQLPFDAQSFDAVVCQFGVMFFPDKNVAYREARRVLRDGGRFYFNVWDSLDTNDFAAVVHETLCKSFPEDPPTFFARTPHGYHDAPSITASLSSAGFRQSTSQRLKLVSKAPDAMYVAQAFCQGTPMRKEIESRAPGHLTEITGHVAEAVETRFGKGPLEAFMQAFVFMAQT